jgi:hypothetical protein
VQVLAAVSYYRIYISIWVVEMPGLRQHLVTEIARTLRDRYHSGFPILKELIQNADDAEASRIVFGHHPGFASSSSHPLLSGPALWIFNDGKFKKSDATAIEYFGINTKAGDDAAIGKFGLGMKSVFHLCEAFFYVAFDGVEIHKRILNPWYSDVVDEAFHNDWEKVAHDDWQGLHEIGKQHAAGRDSWFLMWIPLRRKIHKRDGSGNEIGAIVDRYPGDTGSAELEFLRDRNLEKSLAFVLPLLKHLQVIEHVGNSEFPGFAVRIESENGIRLDHRTSDLAVSGRVLGSRATSLSMNFSGVQVAPNDEHPAGVYFEKLRALEWWPKSFRLNDQHHFEQVRDKSRAEAAVLLQATDGDVGRVSLDWAVFLPVEEGPNTYSCPIHGTSRHYRFVLHGQFFVDAGRRGINGYGKLADGLPLHSTDMDEAVLAVTWNKSVAQRLVLPNLLTVMSDYVKQATLADDDITLLTAGLQSARSESGQSFFPKYRPYVCHDQSWVCVMSAEGRAWRLVKRIPGQRLLALPRAPNDAPQRPWQVLPGLMRLRDVVFCDVSKPRLSLDDASWDEAGLQCALYMAEDSDLMKAFGTPTGLDYLSSFLGLEERRYVSVSTIQDALFHLLRRAFRVIPLAEIRKNREKFRAVVRYLNRGRRVAIGTVDPTAKNAIPSSVFADLFAVESTVLVLPLDLDPIDVDLSSAVPSDQDLTGWLKCIDISVSQDSVPQSVDRLLSAAESILGLRSGESERATLLRVNRDLRVVRAVCPRTGKQVATNLSTLMNLQQRGNLFLFSGGTSVQERLALVPLVARAVPEEDFLVIDSATGRILRAAGSGVILQSGSPSDALLSIGHNDVVKSLGSESNRLSLIQKAHEGMRDKETRRGLRYLLHGVAEHFADDSLPLWIEPSHRNSPWIKTWKMVDQAHWNVLSAALANSIPRVQWEEIGIKAVDPAEVIERLTHISDLSVIDPDSFSASERDVILGMIDDRRLWLSMPLHRDNQGYLGVITDDCYLRTDHRIPSELSTRCRLIEESGDNAHRDKQCRFLRPFDSNAVIRLALSFEQPVSVWDLILDELSRDGTPISDSELIIELRSSKWIPLKNGGAICPNDIIDAPELADDIDRLAAKAEYLYAGVGAINDAFRSHRGYARAETFFSNADQAIKPLGLLLSEVEDYWVGCIRAVRPQELQEYFPFVNHLGLPGWMVAKRCADVFGVDVVSSELLPHIRRAIAGPRISTVLQKLSTYPGDECGLKAIFSLYLELLPTYPRDEAIGHLRSLNLLTKSGVWRPSIELCDGGIGIDSGSVLDSGFSQILANVVVQIGGRNDEAQPSEVAHAGFELMVDSAPSILAHYFSAWESLVRPATVGAFVAVLGTRFRELAEKWLQPHSVDVLYDSLGWEVPGARSDGAGGWMQGASTSKAFGLLRVGIREIHGDSLEVPNLFGDSISVPLTTTIENLVAGGLYWKGGYSVEVRIRKVPDLAERSASDLGEILRKSATYVLEEAYEQRRADLTALWEQLEESDQLELSVARALILDNLPIVLRQIGAQRKNADLSAALKHYDKARRAKTETEQSHRQMPVASESVHASLRKSLDALADLLVLRDDVQADVLSAVRDKLRDYQYDPSGVLFELFQNADDATIELQALNQELHGEDLQDEAARFVVDICPTAVRAIHWGRPINYCPTAVEDGRADDFRRDLEKMLILSASDKNPSSGVTGKFGLGFKSVLLATDSPKILSGDLRFEIVGGVLPQQWRTSGDTAIILSKYASHLRRRGTVTEIPIEDEALRSQVLERFSALSGLQAVFGRKIREIRIVGASNPVPRGHWKRQSEIGQFETGMCDIPNATGWGEARLLVYRGDAGCVAIRSGSRGAEKLDGRIPPFWVTAPTRESESVGFVVNAGFEVDAGRSRLASNSKHNNLVAKRLGLDFGGALAHLFQEGERDWDSARAILDLSADVSQADYWSSIWRAIQQRRDTTEAEAHKLAQVIVSEALSKLTRVTGRVPNGLHGQLSGFASITSTLVAFNGVWRSDAVLNSLAGWAPFQERYPKSQWIADDLAVTAGEFSSQQIQRLNVRNLVDCIDDGQCDSETAACLNRIAPRLLEDHLTWNDMREAKSAFASLKFLSQTGSWSAAESLVSKESGDPDEILIADFAPRRALLAGDYTGGGFSFFIQCRNERGLPIAEVAQFILEADTDGSRGAALRYLGQGEHARDLANIIRECVAGTWLEKLDSHIGLMADLSDEIRLEILLRLRPGSISYQGQDTSGDDDSDSISGDDALRRIAHWWESEGRDRHLRRYEQQFWPANVSRDFAAAPVDRRAWMTLFGLGLTQRMGRVKDSQHRGFIQSLDSKGWWNVFCNVKPQDDAFAWFKVLEEYGEKQIDNEEFGLWMDNFARLYRVARWLDVYVHVFRTIDQRADNQFGPLLNPGADPIFQGDDEASAPSVERSLRNGQHLVIRELLRTGVLKSAHAERRAFIPSWSVRQFFSGIGFDEPQSSEEIYLILSDALDDPTFGGDFDIPLRIIAHDIVPLGTVLKG